MNKKKYQKPALWVLKIQASAILAGSEMRNVNTGGTNIGYEGGGDGTDNHGGQPRARRFNSWYD